MPGSYEIKTYVIDVLKFDVANWLLDTLGASLFENPAVVKILHGCVASDLTWMVRDFGIKLVCTFDTQEFQRTFIGKTELSLANFWQRYCQGVA